MIKPLIRLSLLILLTAAPVLGCSVKPLSGWNAPVPVTGPKVKLMSQAITAYTNLARCKAGLPALKYDRKLTKAADIQSSWMAKSRTLSHTQTNQKHRDLGQRFKVMRIKFTAGAENIGKISRMAFPRGAQFRIKDAKACQFTTQSNKPIPVHSYQSLAADVVGLWMASPGHKRNILTPNLTRHGAMARFDPKGKYCGDFYITQNFAG